MASGYYHLVHSNTDHKLTAMKDILILGAGTAGTMMANKLRKKLNVLEWNITLVDKDKALLPTGFSFHSLWYLRTL